MPRNGLELSTNLLAFAISWIRYPLMGTSNSFAALNWIWNCNYAWNECMKCMTFMHLMCTLNYSWNVWNLCMKFFMHIAKVVREFLECRTYTKEHNGIGAIKFWSESIRKSMDNLEDDIIRRSYMRLLKIQQNCKLEWKEKVLRTYYLKSNIN